MQKGKDGIGAPPGASRHLLWVRHDSPHQVAWHNYFGAHTGGLIQTGPADGTFVGACLHMWSAGERGAKVDICTHRMHK